MTIIKDDPEQLNPIWQLPEFVDQVRRIHLDLIREV
jgi:hypothetical protein